MAPSTPIISEHKQADVVIDSESQSCPSKAQTNITCSDITYSNIESPHILAEAGFGGQPDLQVPTLSLAHWREAERAEDDLAKRDFADRLDDAFGRYGFAAVVDHGIDPEVIDRAYAVAEAFFSLPENEKAKTIVPGSAGQRGYTPDGETAKGAAAPDLKAFFQVGRSDNVAPAQIPDFLPAMLALIHTLDPIADQLLAAISLHEVGNEQHLPAAVLGGRSLLRAIHYPPLAEQVPAFSERAAAHEDINFITLLLSARAMGQGQFNRSSVQGQGLQLKVPLNGQRAEEVASSELVWVNARVPEDALIINVGEMLQRWTNGAWRATTHRVINPSLSHPERQVSRLSLPFFVHPRAEFSLCPHSASVARAGGLQHYKSVTAEEALAERLRELRRSS
jgi:isopenicillin N synthase-like dioxygenase